MFCIDNRNKAVLHFVLHFAENVLHFGKKSFLQRKNKGLRNAYFTVDFSVFGTNKKKQITGIEPAFPAWEAGVLPMNHICKVSIYSIL